MNRDETAPWSGGHLPPRLKVPAGAVDCHHHIYDARFPVDPRADLRPPDATAADYRKLQLRLGTTRSVVVQPSTYGTDNRCLLDALATFGDNARGVAVVGDEIGDAELRQMDEAGVRGIRFNFARPAGPSQESLEALARRIAPLGWHVQIHALADGYPALEPVLRRLPVPVVIDHLGRLPQPLGTNHPAWPVLRRLVDSGHTWVKLSGAYQDSKIGGPDFADSSAVAVAWLQASPERLVWGTDWPYPSASAGEMPIPDDAELLDLLPVWAPSEHLRQRLLVDNPCSLYGFAMV